MAQNKKYRTLISTLDDMLTAAKFVSKIQAVLKSLSLPVAAITIERSFSTLWRIKAWLHSTMSESRLTISGLSILSIKLKQKFLKQL